MTSILNLSNWRVISVDENDHDYRVTAEYEPEPAVCPNCGVVSPRLRKWGTYEQIFMDLPVHAKRTGINVIRRRYQCQECKSTFSQALPDMDDEHTMTKRLLKHIKEAALSRPFTRVAGEVGIHERSVRRIFKDHIEYLDQAVRIETPHALGIDEVKLAGDFRCVLANVEARTMVDILEKRNQKSLAKWLSERGDRKRIELVAMDMWNPYRLVVRDVLPKATIVIDKFHIVRMANDALDEVRKSLRESLLPNQRRTLKRDRFVMLRREKDLKEKDKLLLSTWKSNFPRLAAAHTAKEEFMMIWEAGLKREEAIAEYDKWQSRLPESVAGDFGSLTTAVGNWKPEIFNYFDHPITNAYTEALNGLAKLANRTGRGYSFDAIRAKILYTEGGIYSMEKPKYQRAWKGQVKGSETPKMGMVQQPQPEYITVTFTSNGPGISTLAETFSRDEFWANSPELIAMVEG